MNINRIRPATHRGFFLIAIIAILAVGLFAIACGDDDDDKTPAEADPVADPDPTAAAGGDGTGDITVYSGRSESLVGPLMKQFSDATGIKVSVKYGDTAQLAATILEEGGRSPADVFFAQDAGALGALQQRNRLTKLPDSIVNLVEPKFRSLDAQWVGVSGRARVVAYNTTNVQESELPASIKEFTNSKWKNKIGWAPTNGSFQAFVTAMRVQLGEDATKQWLEDIKANGAKEFPNNTAALQAVASGEINVAFINHYYLFQLQKQQGSLNAKNYYLKNGDVGALINVAGVGILNSSKNKEDAQKFVKFLLSSPAQQYFASETFEYPLLKSETIPLPEGLPSLSSIQAPNIDLSKLADLEGTLKMLRETGALP